MSQSCANVVDSSGPACTAILGQILAHKVLRYSGDLGYSRASNPRSVEAMDVMEVSIKKRGVRFHCLRNDFILVSRSLRGLMPPTLSVGEKWNSMEDNVSPWVERRTLSRDSFPVKTSQVYEDIANVSLIYSHFSSRKPVCNENYSGAGHAVDRFVGAIDRRLRSSPLLNRVSGSLFEAQSVREKVLSRMSMIPSFEDTLLSEIRAESGTR